MAESKRLLALFVDGRLQGHEVEAVRQRMATDPSFARRVGMYQEDDLLLRDTLESLRLAEGLARRICADLPEREAVAATARLGPRTAVLLFFSAAVFVAGTVLFQGTARTLGLLGLGGFAQMVAHVAGVLAGFALLVWSGREAMRLHSTLASIFAEIASRPVLKLAAHTLGIGLFLAAAIYSLAPDLPLRSWDAVMLAVTQTGTANLAVALGIPLLVGLLVQAGEFLADDSAVRENQGWAKVGNTLGLLFLVGACAAHYFVVVV